MLVAYTVEILPFGIRARGFAMMVCSSRFYALVANLLSELYDLYRYHDQPMGEPKCL